MSSNSKCIALTGPNASGKTIVLSQVALIVFMAHIGSFVPCSEATIGITDKILTRVRTRFSASLNESSFMIDLKQACNIVTESTSKSLVIMDEFGKGTIPQDGMGLFAAITSHLIAKKCHVIVATHFHELFQDGLLLSITPQISFYTLDIQFREQQITYLYKLKQGKSIQSLGIQCAQQAGCPTNIITRAQAIASNLANNSPIPSLKNDTTDYELVAMMFQIFLSIDFSRADLDLESELWSHLRPIELEH